jgi:hypothetical protein
VLFLKKSEVRQLRTKYHGELSVEDRKIMRRFAWFSRDVIERGYPTTAIVSIRDEPWLIHMDMGVWGKDFVLWLMDSPHVVLR